MCVSAWALLLLSGTAAAWAQNASTELAPPARAAEMRGNPAMLPVRWDAKAGKLYLGVRLRQQGGSTRSDSYILTDSLPFGVGQNDLGLDRGQLEVLSGTSLSGGTRLVHFERIGPKLLLVEENTEYRTASEDPAEQLAVRQSFPASVLAGFQVNSEADGFVVVDATEYFLRDVHGVAETLA